MDASKITYDKVFSAFGMSIISNPTIKDMRDINYSKKSDEIIWDWIPQEGFQERVMYNDADVLVIGGKRGSGKTRVITLAPIRNINNPLFKCVGFRKEEGDIQRGIWDASKPTYEKYADKKESDFLWTFPTGAQIQYTHLANEAEVIRRFRGVEIPFMIIDELPQIGFKTFFDLLASNRNSLGIRNQFIGTCNPVNADHWLYQFVEWYIDKETGLIIPERNGVKRYFFKWGETINEIYWGNTKEEVYAKAKDRIDIMLDEETKKAGLTWRNLINSLCFIEGSYSENKIFIKNDPNYLGNLAQQGGMQALNDLQGRWGGISSQGSCEISAEDFERIFTNTEQRTGIFYMVVDVAIVNDNLVIGIFDGSHLDKVYAYKGVGSGSIVSIITELARKHHVQWRNIAFDSDGVGQYLKEPLHSDNGGAIPFNNNSASSDKQIWYNQKSECIDKFIRAIKEGDISVGKEAAETVMPDGKTFAECLRSQRAALVKKTDTNKEQYITKREMKLILGHKKSPDEMDMMYMQQIFKIRRRGNGGFKGLSLLRN